MIYVRQTYVFPIQLLSHTLVCEFLIAWFMSDRHVYYYHTHTSLWIHEWLHDLCQTYVWLSSEFVNSWLHDFILDNCTGFEDQMGCKHIDYWLEYVTQEKYWWSEVLSI